MNRLETNDGRTMDSSQFNKQTELVEPATIMQIDNTVEMVLYERELEFPLSNQLLPPVRHVFVLADKPEDILTDPNKPPEYTTTNPYSPAYRSDFTPPLLELLQLPQKERSPRPNKDDPEWIKQKLSIELYWLQGQTDMPEEIQVQRIKKHKSILGRAQGAGMIHIQGFDIPFTIVPSFETIENIRKTYQLNPQNCCIITTANKSTKEQLEQQFGYRVGWVKVSGDDEERYRRFSDVWGRMFSEEAGVNKSYFSVLGLSREEREALTPTDKAILRLLHDFPPAFPEKITIDTLRSHFQENEKMGVKKCEIVIMGCPSYNNFGDDIEPQMIPSRRDEMVNYVVSMLERNSEIIDKHVTLVTVGPDILNYWMTRYCLPPFDDTILSLMESDDPEEVEKLKEKLRISQSLIQEVADLLSQRGIPTNVQSYVSFINTNGKGENEELMEDIDRWVRDNPKIHDPIAEEIRASRAKSYPNYATDRNGVPIEKYKVIRRVKGNSVIYYGMADRLVRNRNEKKPNKILISSEGDAGYWRAYAAEIAKAHGVFPETVLMFHKDFRQPWGADRNREEQISFAAWEKIHDKAA